MSGRVFMTFSGYNENRYTLGGVGATSRFARSALKQRAVKPCTAYCDKIHNEPETNPILDPSGEPNPNYSGFQVWLDGNDQEFMQPGSILSQPEIEHRVLQWDDKVPLAHNAKKYGGGQNSTPYYIGTLSPDVQNGNTSLRFDASLIEGLAITISGNGGNGRWLHDLSGLTIFYTFKIDSLGTDKQTLWSTSQGDLTLAYDPITSNLVLSGPSTPPSGAFNVALNPAEDYDGQWIQTTTIFDGTGLSDSDKLKFRVNRVFKNLTFTPVGSVGTTIYPVNTNGKIGIGLNDFNQNPTEFFNGLIGEILVYIKTLNDDEVNSVEGYLGNKWGI